MYRIKSGVIMVSYNSLVGLPVISNSKKVAIAKDILFCSRNKCLLGIIVEEKGLLNKPKYIPLEQIQEINKVSIIITDLDCIKPILEDNQLFQLLSDTDGFKVNSQVYSNGGKSFGKIKDIVFNFETGIIDSFIVTDGVIEDLISGRKVIQGSNIVKKHKKWIVED